MKNILIKMPEIPDFFSSILEISINELKTKVGKKFDVKLRDYNDQTCLHMSCFIGNLEITELLLKNGADVNAKDKNGVTPLLKACASNHWKIVEMLIANKADINAYDTGSHRAIHVCASNNAYDVLNEFILPNISCINITDKEGKTAVHYAVINGHEQTLKLLIEYGASISIKDKTGSRPIHWASFMGHTKIMEILLENNANVNCIDDDKYTPLHVAAAAGHLDIVIKLIENKADLDCLTNDKNTPIHLACANNHLTIVEEILKALSSPHLFQEYLQQYQRDIDSNQLETMMRSRLQSILNIENSHCYTAIHLLAQLNLINNDYEHIATVIEYLIDSGAKPDVVTEDGKTSLHLAVIRNSMPIVIQLVNSGVDINVQDENENTPIYLACYFGYKDIVEYLLEQKADIFIVGEDGRLPIHVAALQGHNNCIQILLDVLIRRMHIDEVPLDVYGRNLVHCAVIGGSLKCLETFLRLGCKYFIEDNYKMNALHLAVKTNNFIMTRIFIKLDLDVNSQDEYNCTPLHYAAMYNKDGNIIKLLMENNADVLIKIAVVDPSRFIENHIPNENVLNESKIVYPVHFAAMNGNVTGLKMIFEEMQNDVRIDVIYGTRDSITYENSAQYDQEILSVVNIAAFHDQFDVLTHCVRQFSKDIVTIHDRNGRNPLHLAAYQGHTNVGKFLLSCGAKLTATDNDYLWNSLHYAASQGHDEFFSLWELLGHCKENQRNQLMNSCDEHKRTPLMMAAQNGHIEVCKRLIDEFKVLIDLKDTYGRTALHRATANGHLNVLELLLANNADVKIMDFRERTAIHMAAAGGNLKILENLMQNIMANNQNSRNTTSKLSQDQLHAIIRLFWFDTDSYSPLHFAAAKGSHSCFKYLYELVGDIQEKETPLTYLHCAIKSKDEATLDTILQLTKESLVNTTDKYGWTPIFYACDEDNATALMKLINYNSDLNFKDVSGMTITLIAARGNAVNCLDLLMSSISSNKKSYEEHFYKIDREIPSDIVWSNSDTTLQRNILHWVAEGKNDDLGKSILEKLPEQYLDMINARDINGSTPAHLAVKFGLPNFLSKLITLNADLFVCNNLNQLPVASSGENKQISNCIMLCIFAMFKGDSRLDEINSIQDKTAENSVDNSSINQLGSDIEF